MADNEDKQQKTEEATPRRRDEARDRGQVALSSELIAGIGLCAAFATLLVAGPHVAETMGRTVHTGLESLALGTTELTIPLSERLVRQSVMGALGAVVAVTVPTVIIAALAGYAQVGFRVAPKAIEINPGRLNPVKGMEKLFSLRSVVRTTMAGGKVTLITVVVVVVAWWHVQKVVRMGTNELGPLLVGVGQIALRSTAAGLVVIIALGLVDLAFQRYQLGKDLRMTKREIKEETRLTEGDPHVRARVRQIQRELAGRRMMDEVPDSSVVVTNPTHYAVALKYDYESSDESKGAPVVVAKGVDHIAQRIKEIAAENGIACYEDVPLARALHAQVEVGQEIPESLYSAVAAVLGYVYRLRGAVAGT